MKRLPRAPRPRLASAQDAPTLHQLLFACRSALALEPSCQGETLLEWLERRCERKRVWKVLIGGELGGAMVLQPDLRRSAVLDVRYLAVWPEHRRRGVARALLRHALGRALVVKMLVKPDNQPMRRALEAERFYFEGMAGMGGWMVYRRSQAHLG